MVEKRYIELMNLKIDSSISAAEEKELGEFLLSRSDGGAQALYDDLVGLSGTMDDLKVVDPPLDLKGNVLAAIRRRQARQPVRRSAIGAFIHAIRNSRKLGFGLTFAGGIAVATLVFVVSSSDIQRSLSWNPSDVTGTMLAGREFSEAVRVDEYDFMQQGLTGNMSVDVMDDILAFRVRVEADESVGIEIAYDETAARFQGFRNDLSRPISLDVSGGSVRWTHSGSNEYLVLFSRVTEAASTLHFRIHGHEITIEHESRIDALHSSEQ